MHKICAVCKKQFATDNPESRLCDICEKIAPSAVDLAPIHATRNKQTSYRAFTKNVRDRMTEIIKHAGEVEYVSIHAAMIRQDAEDLLDE